MIYFDNNATTSIDPAVLDAMLPFLKEQYGNPSSAYSFGKRVAQAVEHAREQVAALIGCESSEVFFTSCGTESDNTALQSALSIDADRKHIITSKVEHSAIIKHAESLARRGYEVTWLDVDSKGRIDLPQLEAAIRPDTAVVSLMWANNETGVLFPIKEAAEICRKQQTLFHTDAVQAVGKIPIALRTTAIQFLSVSGHKLHAPKGVGALYVNRRARFFPFLIGGGQENKRRGGTENTASIVGFGKAAELAAAYIQVEEQFVRDLRDTFERQALERIPGVTVNGDQEQRLPNTTNLSIEGVDSEAMLMILDQQGVCCSAGSACTTGSLEPSHVLRAMGLSTEQARASLRFSFGRTNTMEEVDQALAILVRAVQKLRQMTPGVLAA
jgi:cysteine desulfurase